MTEKEWLGTVIALASLKGWLVHHCRPARVRGGRWVKPSESGDPDRWVTPIQGDPGFPDLVLVRPGRVIFAELKVKGRRLTQAQMRWHIALTECPRAERYTWEPRHWEDVKRLLH